MPTVRQALAENWNAIGDIIIANAAPEKRETTMLTIKMYSIDHVIPLLSTYAKKCQSDALLVTDETSKTMITKLVGLSGITDPEKVQAELLPHIQQLIHLLK